MLLSIISSVKPLFFRYAHSLSCSRTKCTLYFRPTNKRHGSKITLTLKDNGAIDFYYETYHLSESKTCFSYESAIDLLTYYVIASLNLYH